MSWYVVCVCKLCIPMPWLVGPEFPHVVLDPFSLRTDFRVAGCCFSVVLQSCLCFGGKHVLLMRLGCISTLNLLLFLPSHKTCPFPNTPTSHVPTSGTGGLIFSGAAEWAKQSPGWWESHNCWGWKAPADVVQPKPWRQGHLSRLSKTVATWVCVVFARLKNLQLLSAASFSCWRSSFRNRTCNCGIEFGSSLE